MYKVKFTIGNNDVIRCRINRGMEYEYLVLEQKSIHNILKTLARAHNEVNNIDDNYSYVTFNNIEEDELDYLINLEIQREEEIKKEQESEKIHKRKEIEEKKQKEKKKKRNNKIKRNSIIAVSAATFILLSGIALTISNPTSETTYSAPPVNTEGLVTFNQIDDNYEYVINDEIKESNIQTNNNIDEILELDVEENTQNEKYLYCKNNYGNLITKYANMYGIDPNLAIAVFTHERGYHNDKMDAGGAIGLCQIQLDVWDNQDVTAYNFETNQFETYRIKEQNIKNLEENIKAGVMILQTSLRQVSYVVLQGVQCYNYGLGNLNVAFRASGLNKDELNEQTNKEWMQYRDMIKGGDPLYIEHVFQYIPSGTNLHFKIPNGDEINLHYVAEKNHVM